VGAMMPEVLAAADELTAAGFGVDVVCLTSPALVFRALQARRGLGNADVGVLHTLFPTERAAPIVSVLDGHPHTLAFLGGVNRTPCTSLGVSEFGQSGDLPDLYRHFGIDADSIVGAAYDLIQG
jgi:pyruvate dehydrogenase E1 component